MSATATALYVLGGLSSFLGIVLIAYPDLLPWRDRAASSLRRAFNRARRLLGLQPRGRVIEVSGTATAEAVGRASVVTSPSSTATLEEKVAFLLRRDEEAQLAEGRLSNEIEDSERRLRKKLDELEEMLERRIAEAIREAFDRYRPLRILGTGLLALGLALTALAAFN